MPTRPRPAPRARTPYQAALDILARRDCSAREIARRLDRLKYSPDLISQTLERLAEQKLLDDAALAERYARSRSERGYGRRRIQAGLRGRGVGRAHADRAVQAVLDEDREPEAIDRLAAACWKRHAGVPGRKRLARVFAFLVRRGFPPNLVRERLHSRHPKLAGTLGDSPDASAEG